MERPRQSSRGRRPPAGLDLAAPWRSLPPSLRDLPRPWLTAAYAALLAATAWVLLHLPRQGVHHRRRQLYRLARWLQPRLRLVPVTAHAWCGVIAAWARRVPGWHCLVQALAAEAALRAWGVPVRLRVGVGSAAGRFAAHAWLELHGERLIGGRLATEFTALRRVGGGG